jgi:hypothetical protein
MKLSNLISNCQQTFAGVFLAFSLFGFRRNRHAQPEYLTESA